MLTSSAKRENFMFVRLSKANVLRCNQSNAWDAWRWRKSMWLAIHDGTITLGSLYQSEAGRCSWNTDC